MICGGSPCQDFSVSGKQKGSVWTCKECGYEYNPITQHYSQRDCCPKCGCKNIDKTRSSLLVEWLRIVRANKPNWGIYENVKNIVGKQFKSTFDLFVKELEEYGYNVYWKVLNAKDYGIPQNRERVYVFIVKKELDNGTFNFPNPIPLTKNVNSILEDEVDKKYYINNEKTNLLIEKLISTNQLTQDKQCCDSTIYAPKVKEVSNCITARYDAGIQNKQSIGLCVCEKNNKQVQIIGKISEWHQRGSIHDANGSISCLCSTDYKTPKIICDHKNLDNYSIRKLTPKECWRLMGFEDKDIERCIEQGLSNTQLYKQAGNSIVVDVLYYIYKEIYKAMPYLFDDLKVGSYFSGIGAFEKALDKLYNDINNLK